jgi:hypothetical protein
VKVYQGRTFADMVGQMYQDFLDSARPVDVGQWQGLDIRGDRSKVTWEIREAVLQLGMPNSMSQAQAMISPNLPWAEDHFAERVGGRPLNPPPSAKTWPFAQAGHAEHTDEKGMFSHTYPERFWPKHAGDWEASRGQMSAHTEDCEIKGIRFNYGDLDDVIKRLISSPMTRQAYLPVWFPEDTGAPPGERVPCTIGYHFMIREGRLHVSYTIRACDFMRHFRDDVYMAIRLGQFVRDCVDMGFDELDMGDLTMHIGSFHIFNGDRPMVKHLAYQFLTDQNRRLMEAFK